MVIATLLAFTLSKVAIVVFLLYNDEYLPIYYRYNLLNNNITHLSVDSLIREEGEEIILIPSIWRYVKNYISDYIEMHIMSISNHQ